MMRTTLFKSFLSSWLVKASSTLTLNLENLEFSNVDVSSMEIAKSLNAPMFLLMNTKSCTKLPWLLLTCLSTRIRFINCWCWSTTKKICTTFSKSGAGLELLEIVTRRFFSPIRKTPLLFFKQEFSRMVNCQWEYRTWFSKFPGFYEMLELEFKKVDFEPSKLPEQIKDLIRIMFAFDIMADALSNLRLDGDKLPMEYLATSHINKAFDVLKDLENHLIRGDLSLAKIHDASNMFYTMVPHVADSNVYPFLDTVDVVREKMKMLDKFNELHGTLTSMKARKDYSINPYDKYYGGLNNKIHVLDRDSSEFKMIEHYAHTNRGPTHIGETLEIAEVFSLRRESEWSDFDQKVGNVHLLWHGSGIVNFGGILTDGLKITEIPKNGSLFGRGLYFADMVTKSSKYCLEPTEKDEGLLLLCDVALGQVQHERFDRNLEKPNDSKHSIKGLGEYWPNPDEHLILDDGTTVPIGKPISRPPLTGQKSLFLEYNEYAVYNVNQVKLRYLVKFIFTQRRPPPRYLFVTL